MSCFHPVKAFSLSSGGISFVEKGDIKGDIKLPCGQCMGCRIDRARDWSLRIEHESKLYKFNWFLTLTYSEEKLPNPPSLNYRDWQLFAKRTRKACGPFRFFMCGEYGDQTRRPHYHAVVFGLELPDLKRYAGSDKMPLFYSEKLHKLWGQGMILAGAVTPQSANYVARYNLKKVNGDRAKAHYTWVDPESGELHDLEPEFAHMSTRPGIGAAWYNKYHSDFHTHDYAMRDGAKNPVPRYYDRLAKSKPYELDEIKMRREISARPKAVDNTPERLAVREAVLDSRLSLSKRPL